MALTRRKLKLLLFAEIKNEELNCTPVSGVNHLGIPSCAALVSGNVEPAQVCCCIQDRGRTHVPTKFRWPVGNQRRARA